MKTIIDTSTKLSKYITRNSADIVFFPNYTYVLEKGVEYYHTDVTSKYGGVINSVNPPNDWEKNKYRYESSTWVLSNGLEELSYAEAMPVIKSDFKQYKGIISLLIDETSSFNEPPPVELTTLISDVKTHCRSMKQQINALNASTYKPFTVMNPSSLEFINKFDSFR